jgi:hypothetical protein
MIRGGLMALAWLCVGHASAAALYLLLINTPEANVAMLFGSAVLVVAVLWVSAVTNGTLVLSLVERQRLRDMVRPARDRSVPALLVAAAVFTAIWISAVRLETWHVRHAGELDAWWIATFDSPRTVWIHRAISAVLFVIRCVIGLSVALALFCDIVTGGLRPIASFSWWRAAFSRNQLGLVAITVALLLLVWQLVPWRPRWLPVRAEPVFVGVKLALLFVVVHAGWTVMLFASGREAIRKRAAFARRPVPDAS